MTSSTQDGNSLSLSRWMACFTCVKGKVAGLNALLCVGKREKSRFLRYLYRNTNVSVKTLGTLRTAQVSFISLNFSKQQSYTAAHAMDTKDATVEEDVCDTDSTVRTNSGKRKNEETDEAAKQGNRKKHKKCGKQLRAGERYVPPPQKRNPGVSFSQNILRKPPTILKAVFAKCILIIWFYNLL